MRTEDGYIIQKCLDGNAAAFGLLVDKYKKSIYALAYSEVHNFHDAQDITQETFTSAYRKLRTLKRWDNFMGWLYRITINLCRNWVRSRSRRPDSEFIEDQEQWVLDYPSLESHRENMVYESIQDALDLLPTMYRQVLILRYFGGMTVKEISRFLGISPSTIDRRLRGAKSRLKEEILVMMSTTHEQHSLPANFTFHIVEAIKHIKIQPMPRTAGLPWGISLAAGIIIALLSLGSHIDVSNPIAVPTSYRSPNQIDMTEVIEIPVDVLDATQTEIGHIDQGVMDPGGNGVSDGHNVSLLAPGGQENGFPEEPSERIGKGGIARLAFSPDGKLLAVGTMIGIWLYDTENLDEVGFLKGHTIRLNDIVFSPDGQLLASIGWDGTVRFWNVEEQEEIWLIDVGNEPDRIAISPDGQLLAVGAFEAVQLWDIQQRKQVGTLRGQPSYAISLAFSSDSRILASGSNDGLICLWDVETKKQMGILEGHEGMWIRHVAFAPDGTLISLCGWEDKSVRFWNVDEQKQVNILEEFLTFDLSADGNLLVLGDEAGALHLWDMVEQREISSLPVQDSRLILFALSPDGRTVAIYDDWNGTLRLWDVTGKEEKAILEGYYSGSSRICFSPDSKVLAISTYSSIRLWNIGEGEQIDIPASDGVVSSGRIAFSPDGSYVVNADFGGKVNLWDIGTQNLLKTTIQQDRKYESVAFSSDGKTIALGCQDGTIQILDVETWEVLRELDGYTGWVNFVLFSPDGNELASFGWDADEVMALCFWSIREQKQVDKIKLQNMEFPLAYSFEKNLLAFTSPQVPFPIRILDVSTNKQIAQFSVNPPHPSYCAAFSPDGNILVSAGIRQDPVRLWSITDKVHLADLPGHTDQVDFVTFSPDGKWLASSSNDGTVLLWEVNLDVHDGIGRAVEPNGKQLGKWGKVKQMELLQNYPNPFNPETWIPYTLSESEHVKIRIFGSAGHLIRTLDLGQKSPGAYLSKEKAAYWNGRNEAGELVASDVYFYTLMADDFARTRKMTVLR